MVLVVMQADHINVSLPFAPEERPLSQELGMVFSYRPTFLVELEILPTEDCRRFDTLTSQLAVMENTGIFSKWYVQSWEWSDLWFGNCQQ